MTLNPFARGFAPPSRNLWGKATLQWLKRNTELDRPALATMLGVQATTIGNHVSPSGCASEGVWFHELLGALVANWRPSCTWSDIRHAERRQGTVDRAIGELGLDRAAFYKWFPSGTRHWRECVYKGDVDTFVPARFAVVAEALLADAIPCGLPFQEWET